MRAPASEESWSENLRALPGMATAPQIAEWPQPRKCKGAKIFQTSHTQVPETRAGASSPGGAVFLLAGKIEFQSTEMNAASAR